VVITDTKATALLEPNLSKNIVGLPVTETVLKQLDPNLDLEIDQILKHYNVPGAGIAVVSDGQTYLKSYGVKDIKSNEPISINTAFNIGSTSKAFTSTITAILVGEGLLDWDDPITQYVPEFELNDKWLTENVTLRDLCGNRTGLTRSGFSEFASNTDIDVLDILSRLKYSKSEFGFRERFSYVNPGHIAVAVACSRVTGKDFVTLLSEKIWKPLGMNNSSGGKKAESDLCDISSWHCNWRGKCVSIDSTFADNVLGSGGLCLSAKDAAHWLKFHLDKGIANGKQVISESSLQETYSPQVIVRPEDIAPWIGTPDTKFAAYCLGWATSDFYGHRVIRHSGSDLGIQAQIALVPDSGVGVSVYLNKKDSLASLEINYLILGFLLGINKDWRAMLNQPLPDTGVQFERIEGLPQEKALLPLENYAGMYFSHGDGIAEVSCNGEHLFVDFKLGSMYSSDLYPLGGHDFLPIARNPANEFNLRVRSQFTVEDDIAVKLFVPEVGEFHKLDEQVSSNE